MKEVRSYSCIADLYSEDSEEYDDTYEEYIPPALKQETNKKSSKKDRKSWSNECRLKKLLPDNLSSLSSQIQFDEDSLHGGTHSDIVYSIASHLQIIGLTADSTIIDSCGGFGGSSLSFARIFRHVHCIELEKSRYEMILHNCKVCGVDNITVYHAHCQTILRQVYADVIFFDPPWGGKSYREKEDMRIFVNSPDGFQSYENLIASGRTAARYAVVKLPVNYDMQHFRRCMFTISTIVYKKEWDKPNSSVIYILQYSA